MIKNALKICLVLIMGAITTCILYVIIVAFKIAITEVKNERENHQKQ